MNSRHGIGPPETFFLPTHSGNRFCIFHPPHGRSVPRGCVLYVHPFGEEMNKSRRMASMQARQLAAAGIGVLQLDLLGCGDSSGTLDQASWNDWKDDVGIGLHWLEQRTPGPLGLWGLRLGALLALDCVRSAAPEVQAMVLWQPVVNGEQYLTQFLRLSVAGGLLAAGTSATTAELRAELVAGKSLEIAGYTLGAPMAQAIDRLRLAELAPRDCSVDLFEIATEQRSGPGPAFDRVLTAWRSDGCAVDYHAVHGDPFWSTVEIAECPALLAATVAAMERRWTNAAPSAH